MRIAILSFVLIFTFQSQASFLSRIFYNTCFGWSISDVPLSIYHDIAETINDKALSTDSSTNVDERDNRRMESESGRARGAIQTCVMHKSQRSINAKTHKKTTPKRSTLTLHDMTNDVRDVQPTNASIQSSEISQGQLVPQVSKKFEIFEIGKKLKPEEFFKHIYPLLKTFEQYMGFVDYLKQHKMVASFYVYGNMRVVKEAIVEARICHDDYYVRYGDLETALPLALKEDQHDRLIELLNIRKELTYEKDEQRKRRNEMTRFEQFTYCFIAYLAPWRDGTAFKRFLTIRSDVLWNKYPDIFDTLCEKLLHVLKLRLSDPDAVKLLTDLIGQPSLLTPLSFVKCFLCYARDHYHYTFIRYGWREAIELGLKMEHLDGNKDLWSVMKRMCPNQLPATCPSNANALIAALKHFPTKQELEERWIKENPAPDSFLKRLDKFSIDKMFPKVIMKIIIEYADPKPTWADIPSIKNPYETI